MATNAGKGWFAIQIAKLIDPGTHIPDYILEAIITAHGVVRPVILANILDYRLRLIAAAQVHNVDTVLEVQDQIQAFRASQIDRAAIRQAMLAAFPADQINAILAHI
jgi:putative ATP-dependent endonuclease of OLD family